jgi:hypothetical protein
VDKLPANGSLVRFRGMVQDTGLGGELFPATNADGSKLFMYGREDDAADVAVCSHGDRLSHEYGSWTDAPLRSQAEDYSKLRERQLFYVVSVPGETAWAKEVSCLQESCPESSVDRELLSTQRRNLTRRPLKVRVSCGMLNNSLKS